MSKIQHLRFILVLVLWASTADSVYSLPISGRVFLDLNGDGIQGVGEPGLSRVCISDGREVTLTSETGQYHLETEEGRIVFVSLPKGYRAAEKFYAKVDKVKEIDFAMKKWDESGKESFRFVQITDIHLDKSDSAANTFIEDIAELNGMQPKPTFVLATGDLIKTGDSYEYENYVRSISNFKIPIFSLPGNHDLEGGSLPNYQHFLGPDHYSFNVGSCHFVLLNSVKFTQEQTEWIQKDLAVLPKGVSLIFAFHHLPTLDKLKLLGKYGAIAVFTGHWHSSRILERYGVLDINTPPLRFGGIDRHPRGFRLIGINRGKLVKNDLRLGGFAHHIEVVSPQGTIKANNRILPVVINAYDTRYDVEEIRCKISDRFVPLKRVSSWSWRGEFKLPDHSTGEQNLEVFVKSSNGDAWQKETKFTITNELEVKVPLSLKWVASTGGVIGFSSPRFGKDCIAVGIDDKDDLRCCGVSAFTKEGKLLWHYNTDGGVKNNIATANGRIFATSVAGWLYALDETSGKLLWKAGLDENRDDRWEFASTTVTDGIVYAGAHSYVAAFDAQDGKCIWETRHNKNDWKPTSYSVPIVNQGKLVLMTRNDACVLDAKTGQYLWKLEGVFYGCKAINDTLYAIRDGIPVAMELTTGKLLWKGNEKVGSTTSSPAISDGKLVVGTADGRVCAFSVHDGSLLWTAQTNTTLSSTQPYKRGGKEVNTSPAIYNKAVYVGAGDGGIHVFSLLDGKKLGSHLLGIPILSSPLIFDNTLYIGGYDGNLYAFTLSDLHM